MKDEWREVAAHVRNWGRWGPEDEVGTVNLITPAHILRAAQLVRSGKAFSLAVSLDENGPQSGNPRTNPIRMVTQANEPPPERPDSIVEGSPTPFRVSDDTVVMSLQAGTQWDALGHGTYDGKMYNGFEADRVTVRGAERCGIENIAHRPGVIGRGVLLDVASFRGAPYLPPDSVIEPAELDEVAASAGVDIGEGDVVLIRTGWRARFLEQGAANWSTQAPGVSWRTAEWFHAKGVAAVASDNGAVEPRKAEVSGFSFLFHMLAMRDMGLLLGELWNLESLAEDCANDGVYEFLLVAAALPFTRGLGTPVNPIAIK